MNKTMYFLMGLVGLVSLILTQVFLNWSDTALEWLFLTSVSAIMFGFGFGTWAIEMIWPIDKTTKNS